MAKEGRHVTKEGRHVARERTHEDTIYTKQMSKPALIRSILEIQANTAEDVLNEIGNMDRALLRTI